MLSIARDKRDIKISIVLFVHKSICCVYSLEAPHRGASNEYPQDMFMWKTYAASIVYPQQRFSWTNKKISAFFLKKKKCRVWSYDLVGQSCLMPSLHLGCNELTAPVGCPYPPFRAASVRRQLVALQLSYGFTGAVASTILFNSALWQILKQIASP